MYIYVYIYDICLHLDMYMHIHIYTCIYTYIHIDAPHVGTFGPAAPGIRNITKQEWWSILSVCIFGSSAMCVLETWPRVSSWSAIMKL